MMVFLISERRTIIHGYFFKPTLFILFIYFCLFLFCTRAFTFFSLSTGSQLIEISIEDTGNPPPPELLIIFSGGGGLPVLPILIMCKLGISGLCNNSELS